MILRVDGGRLAGVPHLRVSREDPSATASASSNSRLRHGAYSALESASFLLSSDAHPYRRPTGYKIVMGQLVGRSVRLKYVCGFVAVSHGPILA
jgi:hypothetical protein